MTEFDRAQIRKDATSRKRRALVWAIGTALTLPLASLGQQQKVWRLGFLAARSRSTPSDPDIYYDAFTQELRAIGYIEGKNLTIEWRFADGKYTRLPELAAELVGLKVDLIVTHGTPAVRAAKQATSTIPIVIAAVGDVIAAGLVANLRRPGGNVTGLSFFQQELVSKRFELLKELLPHIKQVGYLMNLANPSSVGPTRRAMETAAKSLNVGLQQFAVREPGDFGIAFSAMAAKGIDGVVVSEESAMLENAETIAGLAVKARLCSIGGREYPAAGGLMGYGFDLTELYRRGAHVVDRVLKGANVGDIPVEQPRTFELIINLKAANAIGIKIPESMLIRAHTLIK